MLRLSGAQRGAHSEGDASSEQSPDRESEAPSSWAKASEAKADYPTRSGTPDLETWSFSAKVAEGSPEKRAEEAERAEAMARRKKRLDTAKDAMDDFEVLMADALQELLEQGSVSWI